jgi:hypothetical protein
MGELREGLHSRIKEVLLSRKSLSDNSQVSNPHSLLSEKVSFQSRKEDIR